MNKNKDQDLIDLYADFKEHNEGAAVATVVKYTGHLRRVSKWLKQEGKDFRSATVEDMEQFAGIEAHKLKLAAKTRRTLVAAIRGFYKWAFKRHLVGSDISQDLPYPKTGRRLPVPISLENAEKLIQQPDLDTFQGIRDVAIMSVLGGTGVRISGLVGLNQSSLQFVNIKSKELLFIKVKEKGGKERLLPAPHETRLLLRAYLGHRDLGTIDRTLPDGDQVLFVSVRNRNVPPHEYHGEQRRLAARSIGDMLARYGEAAGIPRDQAHPHALRHLYGTEMVEDDINLRVIQTLLGHSDPNTTAIYTHTAMRKLMQAVSKANPPSKIQTPVTDLLRQLEDATK